MTKITLLKMLVLCAVLSACGKKGPLIVDPPADATLSGQTQGQNGTETNSNTGFDSINDQINGTTTTIQR